MEWMIAITGLVILFLLARTARRPVHGAYREEPLEDALLSHLSALAQRCDGRGRMRLPVQPKLLHRLEKSISYLNGFTGEDRLPAACWLCENGRFLQEETAAAVQLANVTPRLPSTQKGMPHVCLFARELLSHSNADLTPERLNHAVSAWQSFQPMTAAELAALPTALRITLLEMICELSNDCAQKAYTAAKAQKVHELLTQGRIKRAMQLFHRYENNLAFLERLYCLVDTDYDWLNERCQQLGFSQEGLVKNVHNHQAELCLWVGNAISSLRVINRMPWHRILEEMSQVHAALNADDVYRQMDMESRVYYRERVAAIAQKSKLPEKSVCSALLSLCRSADAGSVKAHTGYYLIDDGLPLLMRQLQSLTLSNRLWLFCKQHACMVYRCASWTAVLILLWSAWRFDISPLLWFAFTIVFVYTAQQLVMFLIRRRVHPRLVPRIQLERLTESTQTLIVCPTMITDAKHAVAMVKHLSILHEANPDEHLHFLLLGDFQDSLTGTLSGDGEIVRTASAAIETLCEDTGHVFLYLQRERVYSPQDHMHHSRERKRGGLETLFKLITGQAIEDTFAYSNFEPEALCGNYRYVITLDSDTLLPPGSALRMIGAMMHPLQHRQQIDGRMRGVSVLQPRMETAAHTVRTRLARLLGGAGGTDAYNHLAADIDQDFLCRGTYMGKGIVDPAAFLDATEQTVLKGSVLSHDLLEGELSGCVFSSDIVLYDGHPQTLQGFLYRLHRWTRGDWQLLPYVLPLFPAHDRPVRGALDTAGRFKVWRNLLRSLIAPMRLILLAYATGSGRVGLLLSALLLAELPWMLPFSLSSLMSFLCRLATLPCEAALQMDAIARTIYRLWISRRNLLSWTTAAQLSHAQNQPPMLFFYLSMGTAGMFLLLSLFPSSVKAICWLLAAGWSAFPFILPILERENDHLQRPTVYMRDVLTRLGRSTLTFFETAITQEDHALPPDNIQIEPNQGIAHRTSPTNIGLYLCSLIAAERLRLLAPEEMAERMEETVSTLEAMPKWEGLLYNWYDTRTLEPLPPAFVSSVDCGNLAVCLLTCAQGIRTLLPELSAVHRDLSARLDALASRMRLSALYDPDADLFRIGIDPNEGKATNAHYDLLASEARLLSYVSIMLGQVPVKHWFRLGRQSTKKNGQRTLLSFSGTMFEYLMPVLFHPPITGTLLEESCRAALQVQKQHRMGGAFGISESGYYGFDPNLVYQYKAFGAPELALRADVQNDVLAPYASLLALPLELKAVFRNIHKLQVLGMEGPLGMFEAADFAKSRTSGQRMRIVRSHMAHHQGMILCAICNALENNYIARLFSDLPRAKAYQLLLEERPLCGRSLIRHPLRDAKEEKEAPPLLMQRAAKPLHFPVDAHVLSGSGTTAVIDAQGGGYLSRNGIMLTRFRESCHIPSGMRLYLRDSQSGAYWSATDPNLMQSVRFETAQAVFLHERFDVKCKLRIWVNPMDGAIVHHLTLENQSGMERLMELCSYLEPALAPQRDDSAHPAFQNLFIRTERLEKHGVAAVKRPKNPDKPHLRLWHTLVSDQSFTMFRVQSDRSAFLGRNRSFHAPRALDYPISAIADQLGDMIEPCLSLRGQFILPANGKAVFLFATHMPDEHENAHSFCERYDQLQSALRTYDTALTKGMVTARYLGLSPQEQTMVSRFVGALVYTEQPAQFRHAASNLLPRQLLWSMGLSGDLPILLVECTSADSDALISLMLKAHSFFRMSGFWIDLVFVNLQTGGAEKIESSIEASHSREWRGVSGGVFVFDLPDDDQLQLLRASARLVLNTYEHPDAQLNSLLVSVRARPLYVCRPCAEWKNELPAAEPILFDNGYGGFTQADGNYQITLPPGRQTPAPWSNPLCSEHFGTLACESGLVFSYARNSHSGRLTRWPNDAVSPRGQEAFYLRDKEHRLLWSLTRTPLGHGMPIRITHAPGETVYECSNYGIYGRMHCFTDAQDMLGVRVIQLRNESTQTRALTLLHTCVFSIGSHAVEWNFTSAACDEDHVWIQNPSMDGIACLCSFDSQQCRTGSMSAGAFQGLWSNAPSAISSLEVLPQLDGNTAILTYQLTLNPGESCTLSSGLAFGETKDSVMTAIDHFRHDGASQRLHAVRQMWARRLDVFHFDLPDRSLAIMLNRWLPYQVHTSRLWMRAGFYQAGGAVGFRDQLQDMLSLLYTQPDEVRGHLLECAVHQFEEGDVQHWWHPPRHGVRTHISDDKLFLPYVTAAYVEATGDTAVLEEKIPYLHAKPLASSEQDRYFEPEVSEISEPLLQHCLRAIHSVETGVHGIPLMGGGDWNDGMDRVGEENGESVWLGMFLCEVLRRFAPLCNEAGKQALVSKRETLLAALDRYAWDGNWYLRAWYSNGQRLGSAESSECRIDLLAQSWAVLCGLSRDRCEIAMDSAWQMLYEQDIGIFKLFTPPFDGEEQPGYIAGYLPGVRENGGQYTHAACWAAAALHQLGHKDQAWAAVLNILPVNRTTTRQQALRYRVEPYAIAADVYANPQQRGRGGWTWYTGSAGWYQTVVLTHLFGFQKTGNRIRFRPSAPEHWDMLTITYRYGTATYHLHASRECQAAMIDGKPLAAGELELYDDGRIHEAMVPLR